MSKKEGLVELSNLSVTGSLSLFFNYFNNVLSAIVYVTGVCVCACVCVCVCVCVIASVNACQCGGSHLTEKYE